MSIRCASAICIALAFGFAAAGEGTQDIALGCAGNSGKAVEPSACPSLPADSASFLQVFKAAMRRGKGKPTVQLAPKRVNNSNDLLQSQSDVQTMTATKAGYIYDLYGKQVVNDRAMHASVQLVIGYGGIFGSVIVEMSPSPVISVLKNSYDVMPTQAHADPKFSMIYPQYLMMKLTPIRQAFQHPQDGPRVATQEWPAYGYMASCQEGKIYKSESLGIGYASKEQGMTIRRLAEWWAQEGEEKHWHPQNYNCQTFAKDVLDHIAGNRQAMDNAVSILSHSDYIFEDSSAEHVDRSGKIANWFGDKTTSAKDLLSNVVNNPALKDFLDQPIIEARLWYTAVGETYWTTKKDSRMADYAVRQATLCQFERAGTVEQGNGNEMKDSLQK